MASTHNTLSIAQFAGKVARNALTIKDSAIPFQQCYKSADDAGKKQLLGDWKNGFVRETFSLGADFTASKGAAMQELVTAKRIDWKEYVAAIDLANSQFGYYVSGTCGNKGAGKGKDVTRDDIGVPKHIQAMADALAKACAEYEGARKLCSVAIAKSFAKAE
jgi:hypothetical protein